MYASTSTSSPSPPHYARLFLGELRNADRGGSPHIARVVEQYARPISARILDVLQVGIHSGEFRAVDVARVTPTIAATIVFLFRGRPGDQQIAEC